MMVADLEMLATLPESRCALAFPFLLLNNNFELSDKL